MPPRPCIGCGALTKGSRCTNCKPDRQRNGWAWTAFKQQHKKPYCEECGAATHLDLHHIKELRHGGAEFDPTNVITLCRACHIEAA